ncbi:MAG: type II secretion system protein N [Hyphomonadaceae bacterium]|nr:type II secretion system protein N [Hyphomonadaceae bacterium]
MKFRLWHAVFFIVALLVFGLALAPASIFVPSRPGVFTYERLVGPIWNARAEKAKVGVYEAGVLEWTVSPLSILSGGLKADVTSFGGALMGDIAVTVGLGGVQRLQSEEFAVQGLPLPQGGLVLPGITSAKGLDIVFKDGKCVSAAGSMHSEVLEVGESDLGFRGPALRGTALCGGEDAWLIFEGAQEGERYRAVLSLRANGEAQWQASVIPGTVQASTVLAAAGFQAVEGEPFMELTRSFQWFPL